MVSAFNGGLTISAQVAMLLRECHAVEQHMHFGLHDVLVTMPRIANELNKFSEFRYLFEVHGVRGEKKENELFEGEEEDVEEHSLGRIGNSVDEKNEFGIVDDALYFWSMERLIARRLLGSINVLGGHLLSPHEGFKVLQIFSIVQFLLYEVHQVIAEAKEDVKRERDHMVIKEGENRGGQYTLEPSTGSLRPLLR